jgi:hypothetical protein
VQQAAAVFRNHVTATVLKLFPQTLPLPEQAQPMPGQVQRPAAAPGTLVDELRDVVVASTAHLLEKMFRGADDVLLGLGERAASVEDQRRFIDTMRVLRMEQAAITRGFLHEIGQQFSVLSRPARPEPAAVGGVYERQAEDMEEQVTLINMTSRLKHLHARQIGEVERRLAHAARNMGLPISPQALAPRAICKGFASSLSKLDLEFPIRMVIYGLFDRLMIGAFGLVYEDALAVLTRYGIGEPVSNDTAPASLPLIANAPVVADLRTITALQRVAADTRSGDAAESALAQELLAIINGKIVPGGYAISQRIALAGQMFKDMLKLAGASESQRASADPLFYPLLKHALVDSSLFFNPAHPGRQALQRAVRALMMTAESSRAGDFIVSHSASLQVKAAAVLPVLRMMEPFPAADIAVFQESLRLQ